MFEHDTMRELRTSECDEVSGGYVRNPSGPVKIPVGGDPAPGPLPPVFGPISPSPPSHGLPIIIQPILP